MFNFVSREKWKYRWVAVDAGNDDYDDDELTHEAKVETRVNRFLDNETTSGDNFRDHTLDPDIESERKIRRGTKIAL